LDKQKVADFPPRVSVVLGFPISSSPALGPTVFFAEINPLKAELNPICHLLAFLAHHIFHVSGLGLRITL